MSPEAAEKLKNRYVLMRNGAGEHERETGKKTSIPITVRCVSSHHHRNSTMYSCDAYTVNQIFGCIMSDEFGRRPLMAIYFELC
jgi:hypothetical protein